MGDRAIIVFHNSDKSEYSPAIYLHWAGSRVGTMLEALKARMDDRTNDCPYASARFVGIAHESIAGNLSLGMWNLPATMKGDDGKTHKRGTDSYWKESSHGDAGVFVVDCSSWKVRTFGGYGLKES